jgi:hypothetical protein
MRLHDRFFVAFAFKECDWPFHMRRLRDLIAVSSASLRIKRLAVFHLRLSERSVVTTQHINPCESGLRM